MNESWLVLETSSRVARVGLARAGVIVGAAELDSSRRHARDMISTIDALLKAEALGPRDLTGVMASRGPGSYTGLRVGLMTAKALAYATGCELRAVDTFAAIAHQAPAEATHVWVIADALQAQVYAQRYAKRHDGWFPENPLQILATGVFVAGLAGGEMVSGPGVGVYDGQIPVANARAPEADREPRVESVLAVGLKLPALTQDELFALEPLYLRGSSAEEKAKEPRG
ncbi:tRNA threonylcarbamoyladenosine biosynthesis protein TsaB [Gemmata sp. SH-PL17]|uniref:tRNA (adenosine(37)-N6)-threonylcarbamoyltransferase complex dimerization subunit type 1 TsaB n=1 Tax=Gemmata sp. SH-PL17 TaxID=1630693 RepID=UPI00078D013B|nr:tRNA (adenosine(37)-N6)-threonylcarbamoyltransferase complex dimerization subunit type 1 TsaB [Gemmata sp. SH-PL17]AMV30109.1 tRNA threonylcarbamoyladenosine biosynthesis protein TsaB [Gemmata sp. SH-PL17]